MLVRVRFQRQWISVAPEYLPGTKTLKLGPLLVTVRPEQHQNSDYSPAQVVLSHPGGQPDTAHTIFYRDPDEFTFDLRQIVEDTADLYGSHTDKDIPEDLADEDIPDGVFPELQEDGSYALHVVLERGVTLEQVKRILQVLREG